MMSATKMLHELPRSQLEPFLKRDDRLRVAGDGLKSPFFDIQPGVIVNSEGKPLYDRPIIREKSSVMVVQWGRDAQGEIRLGLIRQKRHPADDPDKSGNSHPPLTFAQVVMGYVDGNSLRDEALREKVEESGKSKVLNVEVLPFPRFNMEPNTFATWHSLVFMEIDLSTVDESHVSTLEFITSVAYLPVRDVLRYIAEGRDETGAYYRGASTLGVLMIFFAAHPELFVR